MDAADRKGRGVDGDVHTTAGREASATVGLENGATVGLENGATVGLENGVSVGLENGATCICGSPVSLVGSDEFL